ncbi:hypothetical protein R3P38DRAFT_304212 [Favolaschia claudopus]|uniref:Uncharacterized protein n=1 Tax=Favolaschia claudopus TaxID=2862362 RepID=A0AAW0CUE2_9AGAR
MCMRSLGCRTSCIVVRAGLGIAFQGIVFPFLHLASPLVRGALSNQCEEPVITPPNLPQTSSSTQIECTLESILFCSCLKNVDDVHAPTQGIKPLTLDDGVRTSSLSSHCNPPEIEIMVQFRVLSLLAVVSVGLAASTQRNAAESYTSIVEAVITGIEGLNTAILNANSKPTQASAVNLGTTAIHLVNVLKGATDAVKAGANIIQADGENALHTLQNEEPTISHGLSILASAKSKLEALKVPDFDQILCQASKSIVAETANFIAASKAKLPASEQGDADSVGKNIGAGFPQVLKAYNC